MADLSNNSAARRPRRTSSSVCCSSTRGGSQNSSGSTVNAVKMTARMRNRFRNRRCVLHGGLRCFPPFWGCLALFLYRGSTTMCEPLVRPLTPERRSPLGIGAPTFQPIFIGAIHAPAGYTEHDKGQTIPILGGTRAVRPWGGLWIRERTHPGRHGEGISSTFTPSKQQTSVPPRSFGDGSISQ